MQHSTSATQQPAAVVPLEDFTQLTTLMGFQDVWDFDTKYAE